MSELRSYEQVKQYLYGLRYHGAKYGIDRMVLFSEALGHPERKFPVIHLAGTNGKGSTAAMLEAIYRRSGYHTGLFTSPHLVHQGERIQVDRQILSNDAIVHYTRQLKPVAEELEAREKDSHPSFFEFMTAMAFLRFAEEEVDVGILETGLGGRLDATNVVDPVVSVITSISLDHTGILGDTVEQIAAEKAGIIKPGKPVVLGRLPEGAEGVVRAIAKERGCRVHSIVEAFGSDVADYPETNLPGTYQRLNAATASLAARVASPLLPVSEEKVAQALQRVSWAGRWDSREGRDGRRVIFDASHNPEGAVALDENLKRLRQETGEKPAIIVGTLGESRAMHIMPVVARHASRIYLVRPSQPRASAFEDLEQALPQAHGVPVQRAKVRELFPEPGLCTACAPGQTAVVTGSIYLVGEAMEAFELAAPVGGHLLQD